MSQSQTTSQENALATAPIGKLLFSLAVPAITAQVVNMLYNIVDRIYIGHIPEIGTAALTGVGITFPIITLISAFSSLIAMGGAPRASIAMGAPPQGAGRGDYGQLLYGAAGALRGVDGGVPDFPGAYFVGLRGQRERHWLRHGLHGHLRVGHGVCADFPGHEHVHHLPGLCQNQHAHGDYRRGAEHSPGPGLHLCL